MPRSEHIEFIGKLKKKVASEYHGKVINLMISGSHLFGFESPDSDTDYRGCFQVSTNKLLGIGKPRDNIQYKIMKDGMTEADIHDKDIFDKDAVLDELEKEVGLLLAGNCNHFEHLYADQLLTSEEYVEMRGIFVGSINLIGLYNSYHGMAHQNYKKFIMGGKHTVKKYLYVLRGLMAGTYAMDNYDIQPNIDVLSDIYDSPVVKELISLKKRGMEKQKVNKNLDKYNQEVDKWFIRIDESVKEIPIVEQKEFDERRNVASEFLVKARLRYLDGYKP